LKKIGLFLLDEIKKSYMREKETNNEPTKLTIGPSLPVLLSLEA
jgi:hypothetical protein